MDESPFGLLVAICTLLTCDTACAQTTAWQYIVSVNLNRDSDAIQQKTPRLGTLLKARSPRSNGVATRISPVELITLQRAGGYAEKEIDK